MADSRNRSLAEKLLKLTLEDGQAGAAGGDTGGRRSSPDDEEEAAIPGAFVAVIFGVFGVLVIGRRSRR